MKFLEEYNKPNKWFRKKYPEQYAYYESEENLKRCEPFEKLRAKYISLHEKYIDLFDELHRDMKAKAYRREYDKSSASSGLHRGYYSPSSLDLVVGGGKRGKLIKKIPEGTEDIYEYVFDEQGNLICVCRYGYYRQYEAGEPSSTELFIYSDDSVLSILYGTYDCKKKYIQLISECWYEEGVLIRYEAATSTMIDVETRGYSDGLMHSLCHEHYHPSTPSLEQRYHIFSRDEEGYLSTWSLKGFEQVYNVSVKRLGEPDQENYAVKKEKPKKSMKSKLKEVEKKYLRAISGIECLSAAELVDISIRLFKEIKVKGISDLEDPDCDMLLFQYGVYDWEDENGRHFELDITRQFHSFDEGEPYQLNLTLIYSPSLFRGVGRDECWSNEFESMDEFANHIKTTKGFKMASKFKARKHQLDLGQC